MVEENFLPLSAHTWYWQRAMRWVKDFGEFGSRLLKDEGGERAHVPIQDLLVDEESLDTFIGWLSLMKVSFSVPRSARRFLSAARMQLGCRSLKEIAGMSDIMRGHERSIPRTKKQAEALEVDDAMRIAKAYGKSKH